ncbi:MAG: (Fe-S)-binding protein [Verrucomicrobiota bacterium]
MITCLSDAFFPDTAKDAVLVLEHLGCTVHLPENQTCCGQPAFNSGDFPVSRQVARHTADVFAGELPIIVPSGSCAAMHFHGHALQFENQPEEPAIDSLANRTWEIFDFIVHGLGITEWGGHFPHKVAIHHSCHTRGTRTGEALRTLLNSISDLELVEFGQPEQCCGFGGTFSVHFPNISSGMGQLKLDHLLEQSPDRLTSADMSCLMHLVGLAEKQGRALPYQHGIQILREALQLKP